MVAGLFGALALSACQQGGIDGLSPQKKVATPVEQAPKIPVSEKFEGQRIGNGPIRLALLVPSGAPGQAGTVGKQLINAASIAVRDFGSGRLQIIVKDTKGDAATSAALAEQARNEGASLVLGPLFSANVSSAASITKPARLPMIAFTSDTARASQNVYLLSFTPQADVQRTVSYGMSIGANRILALLPQGVYGNLVEQELKRTAQARGGQVVAVVRYGGDAAGLQTAARSAAVMTGSANAIYIPDGGNTPSTLIAGLKQFGAILDGKQIMGSGQWESANLRDPNLQGAIFAGGPKENFETFAGRYSRTYGGRPTATAALAYDAVSLAAELVRREPLNPFIAQAIQSPSGFNGATGIFRFQSNGTVQRGLVVNRVQNGAYSVVSPAPTNFSAGG